MNSDIRLQLSFRNHPKTKKLKFKLGPEAVLVALVAQMTMPVLTFARLSPPAVSVAIGTSTVSQPLAPRLPRFWSPDVHGKTQSIRVFTGPAGAACSLPAPPRRSR